MNRALASLAIALMLAPVACQPTPPNHPAPPPASSVPAPKLPGPIAPVASWSPTPDAPFRQTPPVPSQDVAWEAPVPETSTLSNGLKVLVVPRPKLPITVVYLSTLRGADLQSAPGLGSFAGDMLALGTTTRSALQLSDEWESLGAEHESWADWDSGSIWVKVLSEKFDKALDIVADMLQHPAFDKAELERERSQRLAALQQESDVPDRILRNTIARVTYAGHPYGTPLMGTPEAASKYSVEKIRAFYEARFVPDQMIAVVVGDTTRQAATEKLEKALGSWKKQSRKPAAVPAPPAPKQEIVLVDRPGAPQSNIALAGVGVPRTTKDFDAILVANTILGGMFSSRLNLNLREKHAWTYGARTSFDMRHGAGPFSASAAVDTPNTVPALKEMIAEVQRLGKDPVTDDELALAKGTLIKSLPGRFESDGSTAASIATLGIYGLPLDEFRTRPQRLQRITAAEVQAVGRNYLDVSKMRIVVVGDRKALEDELKKLGFGPVRVLDASGKPVGAAKGAAPGTPSTR